MKRTFGQDAGWLVLLVGVVSLVVFSPFIFGDRLYIFTRIASDTYYQYWPFDKHISDMLWGGKLEFWTFKLSLGTQIPILEAVANPYLLSVYALPSAYYPEALVFKAILECLGAALAWLFYMRAFRVEGLAAILASLAYGFNGYLTLWGQHDMFGVLFTIIPVVLYFLEVLLTRHKAWPLMLALAYFLACSFYFCYMFSIFFVVFALVRYVTVSGLQLRNLFGFCIRLAGIYVAAALLSAVALLPAIWQLAANPRVLAPLHVGVFDLFPLTVYASYALRVFSNNVFGSGMNFRGPTDVFGPFNYYELPELYFGLLLLLVIPQLYRLVSRREKTVLMAGFAFVLVSILSPFVSSIYNGFSDVTHRQSYIVVVFCLYAASRGLYFILTGAPVNRRLLLWTYFALAAIPVSILCLSPLLMAGVIALPGKVAAICLDTMRTVLPGATMADVSFTICHELLPRLTLEMCLVMFFLSMYALLLWSYSPARNRFTHGLLAALVVLELIVFTYPTANDRDLLDKGYLKGCSGYFDSSTQAIEYIKQTDPSVFRLEKTYESVFLCDALFQDYFGTKGYSSLQEASLVEFLVGMNVPVFRPPWGPEIKYVKGFGDRFVLNTLVGVKYMLSHHELSWPGYEPVRKVGDVCVYRNNLFLPLGYAYDQYLAADEFQRVPGERRDLCLLMGFLPDPSGPGQITGCGKADLTELEDEAAAAPERFDKLYEAAVLRLRESPFQVTSFREDRITGRIEVDKPGMLFLSIPFNKGWRARLNGHPVTLEKINMGFTGMPLEFGVNDIELRFVPRGLKMGLAISGITLLGMLGWIWSRRGDPDRHA